MRNVLTLLRKELNGYFLSPLAYVSATFFLFLSGVYFTVILAFTQQASLRDTIDAVAFFFLLVVPLITMRLIAEEKQLGTLELLMTAPVTDWQVCLAKFLSGIGFYLAVLLPTLAYVLILRVIGTPDYGTIVTGYIGLLLIGCLFVSVGLFASSVTRNQIVAAIITFVILLFLWIASFISPRAPWVLRPVFDYVGAAGHFDSFRKGIIDSRDVVYYVSFAAFFLFLTVRSVESGKWR